MNRQQIQSIHTGNKTIVVNRVNQSYEIVFKIRNRLYATVWVKCQHEIDRLIVQFLATGEVDHVGVWVV